MKVWKLSAVLLLTVAVSSCGGNSTAVGVTLSPTNVNVPINGTQQFTGSATGSGTTTVYWQICLPAATPTTQPTDCTPIPGITPPSGTTVLTGYGTITTNGLYTAPSTIPQQNSFVIMASSVVSPTSYALADVSINTLIRVRMNPTTASLGTLESIELTATVTGTTNTAINWTISAGSTTVPAGTITPNGPQTAIYTAPANPADVVVTATSAADPSESATATMSIGAAEDPTLSSMSPSTVPQGSIQQDVYLTGSGFFTTSAVVAGGAVVPDTYISGTLIRATIPAAELTVAGPLQVEVQRENGDLSPPQPLDVVPVRPAIISSTPDSVSQDASGANVSLVGGFFVPGKTLAEVNGSSLGVGTVYVSSQELSVSIPPGDLTVPGLYQVVVQNSDAANAGVPSLSGVNVAVTPQTSSIPSGAVATLPVGANPSAVAIDYTTGTAVVANSGGNSVTLVNLATNTAAATISVGKSPSGVAVDDLLSPPVALVVNSGDQTVSAISLATQTVTSTLSVSIGPVSTSPAPYAIGINPLTHRAVIAYQSTNIATILDLSSGTPTLVGQVGGTLTSYGTGQNPAVEVDPRLNWALVTPGGGGPINLVDLGTNPSPGDIGRLPLVIGSLSISTTMQGIGLNTETHQALLTDPKAGTLTSYSLLNNGVNSIVFTYLGLPYNQPGFVGAAASPLTNVGVAVNATNNTATVVDLENGNVLTSVATGNSPQAVAIDPVSNEAVVANQADGTVSIISLGSIEPLQIIQATPSTTYTSSAPLTLTIVGNGFVSGSAVRLDQVPVPTATVAGTCTATAPITCRELTATVPASMLGSARRYIVDVQNPDQTVSNVTSLTVIQPVVVGTSPVGVAVDQDRDMAVVTNSGDGTVSLVALSPTTPIPNGTAGAVGTIGPPVPVGTAPEGVALLPRQGVAVVANSESSSATLVDETQTFLPETLALCTGCEPTGVAFNQDEGMAAITNGPSSNFSVVTLQPNSLTGLSGTEQTGGATDQYPAAVAVDPTLNYAAIGTTSPTSGAGGDSSSVDFVLVPGAIQGRASGFQLPSGIVFDPVNQVFLVADSLLNNIVAVDPNTFVETPFRAGINPTSIDYNYQTSSIVTVNSASHTMSVMDYVCPPNPNTPPNPANPLANCPIPQVRAVLGLGGSENSSSVVVGPNAVAVDPKLNLAVLVDQDNNRVLLVPLPY